MLEVKNLYVSYGETEIVKDVTLTVGDSEIVGIVGESGSGKTTLIKSILGLLGNKGRVTGGSIVYNGESLTGKSEREMRGIRGNDISLVSQFPEQSMDQLFTVGDQMFECMKYHREINKEEFKATAAQLFHDMGLNDDRKILKAYPFELSGGMSQRVAIAMALSNGTKLLLADEPTSALDVTVQSQVVELMMDMRRRYNMSILIVSHNIGVIAKMADRIGVMFRGEMVDYGDKDDVIHNPRHEYTKKLLSAVPKL